MNLYRAGHRLFCVHCVMIVWLTGRAPKGKCAVAGCGGRVAHA